MSKKTVDPETLQQWLKDGSAILVDVREPAEYRAGHIRGARLMPLSRLDARDLPRSHKIVVHCVKGGRGDAACDKLLKQDSGLEVFNLEGGLEGWSRAGLAVEQGERKVLPLDRQVQLAIGILLLIAAALAVLVDPAFVWVTALIGAGLTIAGLTGFCGMARLIAQMPWNR